MRTAPAVPWRGSALVPPLRGLPTAGRLGVVPLSERFRSLEKIPHRSNPHRFAEPPVRGHKGLATLRRCDGLGWVRIAASRGRPHRAAPTAGWRGSALVPPLRGLPTAGRLGVVPMSERSGSTGCPTTMQPPPFRGAPCEGAQGSGRPCGALARQRPWLSYNRRAAERQRS